MTAAAVLANRCLTVAARRPANTLSAALNHPQEEQARILRRTITRNAASDYGRRFSFTSIDGYESFRARVPIVDHATIAGDLDRIAAGDPRVLTDENVRFLEPTGGSSGPTKLIPYTDALRREVGRAVGPWMRDLMQTHPRLARGRSYWAVSPPGRTAQATAGGLRIGAPHDTSYLPRALGAVMGRALLPPAATSRIPDIESCRYVTALALLGADDLTLVSVWSPSFLTLLLQAAESSLDMLLWDMEHGRVSAPLEPGLRRELEAALPSLPQRANGLRAIAREGLPQDMGEVWPQLTVISCWTDGHARRAAAGVATRFPGVVIQGKGLMATEGVVSIPLSGGDHPVAAVTSHFLEFLPAGGGEPVLVHELERDGTYEVVITTGGGLYRYRMKDLVRVEGYVGATPTMSFVGRSDGASDLCGEKLTPALVEAAITDAMRKTDVTTVFAMLSPRLGPVARYDLWLDLGTRDERDGHAQRLAAQIEDELRAAHHYDLCRRLGQLDPVVAHLVPGAERLYEKGCVQRGQRAGLTKPPALDARLGWETTFEGGL